MSDSAAQTDYSGFKPGDEIECPAGRIKLTRAPEYQVWSRRWYVPGHKWIKSKQKFSSNALVHSFVTKGAN